jgi:hypothetical protein
VEKRPRSDQDKIQYKTVQGYVSAIMDLYNTQSQRGENMFPNPSTPTFKRFIASIKSSIGKKNEVTFVDRGEDDLALDDNQIKDLYGAIHSLWSFGPKDRDVTKGMKTKAMVNFSVAFMCRGQLVKGITLSRLRSRVYLQT